MSSSYTLILGSNSPRRKQLLKDSNIPFDIQTAEIDEQYPADLNPYEVPEFIAKEKANAITCDLNGKVLITADTMVISEEGILGKPDSPDNAKEILRKLSGKSHKAVTGICLTGAEKQILFSVTTEVTFRNLSEKEIEYYVKNYPPLDKAGSYGIQEWIGLIGINSINGSYPNVMGMPVSQLLEQLKNHFDLNFFD